MAVGVTKGLELPGIVDRMLDLPVTTTYREMLAVSPGLQGAFNERLRPR